MDSAYAAFVIAGAATGAAAFLLRWRRGGQRIEPRVVVFIAASITSAVAGARLYALVEQGWYWDRVTSFDGSLRQPGCVLGLLIGFAVWRPIALRGIPAGYVADVGAVATQFGLAVARVGCLAAGCCFGTVADLPWAIRFPFGSDAATLHASLGLIGAGDAASRPVHPLQIYFMLLHVGVGGFLCWFEHRKAYDGQLLLLGLLLGQAGKALLEGFRQPIPGAPVLHLRAASVALASGAALALVAISLRSRRRRARQGRTAQIGEPCGA